MNFGKRIWHSLFRKTWTGGVGRGHVERAPHHVRGRACKKPEHQKDRVHLRSGRKHLETQARKETDRRRKRQDTAQRSVGKKQTEFPTTCEYCESVRIYEATGLDSLQEVNPRRPSRARRYPRIPKPAMLPAATGAMRLVCLKGSLAAGFDRCTSTTGMSMAAIQSLRATLV